MMRKVIVCSLVGVFLWLALVCPAAERPTAAIRRPIPIPRPVPVIRYIVASPRAALIGRPAWSTDAWYLPSGGAENFARKPGSLRVRVGTRVWFGLSPQSEGVWYAGSAGVLATSLKLQWCVACKCEDADWKTCVCDLCGCEACLCAGCVECELDDATLAEVAEEVACPWITIGRDGAKAARKGPSIGHARVGVPVRFRKPGIYYLRAIIRTTAQPWYPEPLEPWYERLLGSNSTAASLPAIPPAVDRDVVYVRVHVTNWGKADGQPIEAPSQNPDAEYGEALPRDPEIEAPVEVVLSGDELIVPDGEGSEDTPAVKPIPPRGRIRKTEEGGSPDGTMIRDRDRLSQTSRGDVR